MYLREVPLKIWKVNIQPSILVFVSFLLSDYLIKGSSLMQFIMSQNSEWDTIGRHETWNLCLNCFLFVFMELKITVYFSIHSGMWLFICLLVISLSGVTPILYLLFWRSIYYCVGTFRPTLEVSASLVTQVSGSPPFRELYKFLDFDFITATSSHSFLSYKPLLQNFVKRLSDYPI